MALQQKGHRRHQVINSALVFTGWRKTRGAFSAEAFCDEITLIDHGHIILSGNLPDIKSKMGNSRLRVSSIDKDPSTLHQQLSTQISDIEIEEDDHSLIIELKQQKSKQAFLKECFDKGIILDSFGPYEPSLQEVFIKLVGEENA